MTERVTVVEIKTDSDPFGGEYVQVALGYKIPVPTPKNLPPNAIAAKPPFWKHALHIFMPKEQWMGQYAMYQELIMEVKPNGEMSLREPE